MVLRVLELKPHDSPDQQLVIQNLSLRTVCLGGKSYWQFFESSEQAPEDHLDANVYYRELGMQLSREVSLGDTIYTEKWLVVRWSAQKYFLKTMKKHDQGQTLEESLCLRVEEEPEKEHQEEEGTIRKEKITTVKC